MRDVILHYHIYKNAGTSFDHVLGHSFGDRHELFDGPFPFFVIDQEQLDRIIMRRPAAVALSSHQIMLPPPVSVDYRTMAAIFLRNPFLRLASVYRFKRHDTAEILPSEPESATRDMTSTAIAARERDFAGWLDYCLGNAAEIGQVSNAQTRFFASAHRQRPAQQRTAAGMQYDLGCALRTLCGVELLGRTEHFDTDVRRFADILGARGIALKIPADTRHNITADGSNSDTCVAERAEALLDSLPAGLRDRLIAANRQDMALYDRACALIERDHRV